MAMGLPPARWMVDSVDNPKQKWMMTVGTSLLGTTILEDSNLVPEKHEKMKRHLSKDPPCLSLEADHSNVTIPLCLP